MTFQCNFESVLMRVSGISIKMFTKILLELWKYFEKVWGDFGILCRNSFQEHVEKDFCKRWKNDNVILEKL